MFQCELLSLRWNENSLSNKSKGKTENLIDHTDIEPREDLLCNKWGFQVSSMRRLMQRAEIQCRRWS